MRARSHALHIRTDCEKHAKLHSAMADLNLNPNKKRRWYHNIADAYRITARTYPWIGWLLGAFVLVFTALGFLAAALNGAGWIVWPLSGLMTGLLASIVVLSVLTRKAMYSQIEGTIGSVYAVLSGIKRGWIISEQPIAANREQDLVWRIIGRPGVVLITEGPTGRVSELANAERKKITRVMQNVPVHIINVGTLDGQTRLAALEGTLRKLKNVLTATEVPSVDARLRALSAKSAPIPKGIDPSKVRPSRRALRGR